MRTEREDRVGPRGAAYEGGNAASGRTKLLPAGVQRAVNKVLVRCEYVTFSGIAVL